ncbi:MAG: hypothetical protein Q4A97_06170 [Comamonadaceae bacterium]|nr:hypothetical protein [Comamonadaceae bacterium]
MVLLYRPHQEPSRYTIALRPGVAAGMRVWAGPGQGEAVAWHVCPPASDMDAQAAQQRVQRLVAARAREGFAEQQGAAGGAAPEPLAQLAQALPPWQPEPALAQALRQRLHPDVWRTLTPRQRSRLVWRIGEVRLPGVAEPLLAYAGSGEAMLDYCLAWALCRCTAEHEAQADAVRAQLQHWARQAPDAALQYLAGVAWLALSSDAERERHAQALMADWPARLRQASAAATPDGFAAALAEGALDGGQDGSADGRPWQRLPHGQWLEQLDQVAQSPAQRHWARPLLLQQLQALPLEYGSFRSLRRLYKAAQLRLDAQLLGLLGWRFETTLHKPPPESYAAARGPSAQAAPGQAWGRRTRQYFLRRNWRTLRRLGQLGSPHYVLLATAALLAYDEQAIQTDSRWSLLEHIAGQTARQPAAAGGAGQAEVPFAALWAQCPQAVPLLLQHARHPAVAALAVRLLQQTPALQASLPPDAWLQLLGSGHDCVAQYALEQVRRLLEAGRGDAQLHRRWLAQLARAALPEAQALVLQTLSEDPRRHGRDPELLLALLLAPQPPMRQMARLLLESAAHEPGAARACIQALQHWLEDAEAWSAAWQDVEPDVLWALQQPLRQAAATQPYAPLLPLLEHHVPQAVCWAAAWLAQHPGFAAQPPMAALQRLLDSPEPLHQRAAALLFAALPPRLQQQQPALLLAFAASAHAPVRAVAHSAIAELARQRPAGFDALAQALVQGLLEALFRSEPAPGLHADLLALLQGPLQQAAQALDAATVLRLLLAKSQGAQQLGLWLLPSQPRSAWAVGEWAALARSPLQAARQWAIEAYRSQPEQVQAHLEDALRIFDSRWDDALDFACGYFQQPAFVQAALWPRPRLIGLCDHSQPQAQQCGRALLAQLVPMPELLHYLLQLSQHPSAAMQLLVADWLEQGALDGAADTTDAADGTGAADAADVADAAGQAPARQLARLQQLRPYFVQVLSQVNRARQLKDRVQRFLLAQALQSPEAAAFVSALYERLVLSMAVGDRAHYLHSLLAIQARYPQLGTPLHIQATPLWRRGELHESSEPVCAATRADLPKGAASAQEKALP